MSPSTTRATAGVFSAVVSTVAATVVVAGVGAAPAGAVSTDQSYWVPVDKRVELRGHGYGHGHGMSQYGAQGAALAGKGYREIVDFYYPGTSWSKMRGKVRVLISADTSPDVLVSPAPGLAVRDLGSREKYELPDITGVQRWRLQVSGGETVVGYLTDRWHRFKPGGRKALTGDGEFVASEPMRLWTPSGSGTYRGTLRLSSPSPGSSSRDTVNVVSMDQYVMGVVPYEMPAAWHPEAVRAQAVAARTYATWSRNQNKRGHYQICDTTSCQVYGGMDGEDPRSNAAVAATRRQILTYGGKPAFTQFSSSSGGWTSAGSVPYLPAKEDPYDGWDGNPVHSWSVTIDAGHFERSYPSVGTLRRIQVVNRDGNGDWQGRVNSLVLDGTHGDVTISGDDFRWAFGLRSNWFTIEPTPIISRWTRIGGTRSPLGQVQSKEYRVEDGAAQVFDRGRIFYSPETGARELYGRILRKYRSMSGPKSALGMPVTGVQVRQPGRRALFENGSVFSRRRTGPIALVGKISERYLRLGGEKSELGWPVRGHRPTANGQDVEFQNGFISHNEKTGRTRIWPKR
jgi:stage II sporulation protein D